jgi:hypothetical protein
MISPTHQRIIQPAKDTERLRVWEIRPVMKMEVMTISAKPDGAWAGSQLWILKDQQSGLLMRIATTESVSLCTGKKS